MSPYLLPPANEGTVYESSVSSTLALLLLAPTLEAARNYPGLPTWVQRLGTRLQRDERQALRLLAFFMPRALKAMGGERLLALAAPDFLASLHQGEPAALQRGVLESLASSETGADDLLAHPDELRRRIAGAQPPGEGSSPLDPEQAAALVQKPERLKDFLLNHLDRLWSQVLAPRWQEQLPALRLAAQAARQHFGARSPTAVAQAITGRPLFEDGSHQQLRRVVFSPVPFLGPYVGITDESEGTDVWVAYDPSPNAGTDSGVSLPGGLLPVLTALADETRLQILAYIREKGQGCARDFITGMGLSQPATSRHLRLLESTCLLQVERIDGIKWYRINRRRAQEVAAALQAFLTSAGGEGEEDHDHESQQE